MVVVVVLDEGDRMSSVAGALLLQLQHSVLYIAPAWRTGSLSLSLFAVAADNAQDCGSVELCTTAVTGSVLLLPTVLLFAILLPVPLMDELICRWSG